MSRAGSIDWCCFPRLDSPSVFDRLLDWDGGGYCQIAPAGEYRVTRRYLDHTLVLETTFQTEEGEARLVDCFTMRTGGREHPYLQVLRVVEGGRGTVEFEVRVAPRYDYGAIRPWVKAYRQDAFMAVGGGEGLLIHGDVALEADRHSLAGTITVARGERARLSVAFAEPEALDWNRVEVPDAEELDRRLDRTIRWWRDWARKSRKVPAAFADHVERSALVLKGLMNAQTGAIAAAATTSLPEILGGDQNWDYRASWIRDSTWTVRALAELGYEREADAFRRFSERSAAGSIDDLQVLYGLGGEHRLEEFEVEDLEGYRRSSPVRIGNRAAEQDQHDVFGEILELAWRWHQRGHTPGEDYWRFLVDVVEAAIRHWPEPDRGLWELRGEAQRFVHSAVMCWAAVDRGIRLAEGSGLDAPLDRWKAARDEIRAAVESEGYDEERGVFVRAFGVSEMDGALLLLPRVGFVDWNDERMIRTVEAIRQELEGDGLLYRFVAREGAFLPCSFWLAECLLRQGRAREAGEIFHRASATANDLGLFSEEVDPRSGELLGNFPQGLSHLAHISAALTLAGEGGGID